MEEAIAKAIAPCNQCGYSYIETCKEVNAACLKRKVFVMSIHKYYVSNHGRIVSVEMTKKYVTHFLVKRFSPDGNGYLRFGFNNRVSCTQYVHIVTKWTFHGTTSGKKISVITGMELLTITIS